MAKKRVANVMTARRKRGEGDGKREKMCSR